MRLAAYRLNMTAPLHVGEVGIGQEESLAYLPSDTLFGALVLMWLEMGEQAALATAWLAQIENTISQNGSDDFVEPPPLLLTSAFPYVGSVRLLPKPRLPIMPQDAGKKFKRTQWVSTTIFQQLVNGISRSALDRLWQESVFLQDGEVWVTTEEQQQIAQAFDRPANHEFTIWLTERIPKVTLDRLTNASTLFHVGRVHFAPQSGLWLMAAGTSEWLDLVKTTLYFLADSGIGGQRSRGNGQFSITDEAPLVLSGSSQYQVLLSRLAPTQTQMRLLQQPQASYQLVTVGGWAHTAGDTPLIRNRVRLLREGSVIGSGTGIPGKLVNVNPQPALVNHPILRYGYGFTVPIHLSTDL